MAERKFCDRCTEPLRGKSYELFLMPHDVVRGNHYRADLCEPCYRIIAKAAALPLTPVRSWRDLLYPGLINNVYGELWKRLWGR